jgi:hypothetical protein
MRTLLNQRRSLDGMTELKLQVLDFRRRPEGLLYIPMPDDCALLRINLAISAVTPQRFAAVFFRHFKSGISGPILSPTASSRSSAYLIAA